jgi:hypothetical protein
MAKLTSARGATILIREISDMRFVDEIHMVRHSMYSYPVHWGPACVEIAKFFHLWLTITDGLVTGHTEPNCRNGGGCALGYVSMTKGTVETNLLNMMWMGERYRLLRSIV